MNIYLQQDYSIEGMVHMNEGEEFIFNFPVEGQCKIKVTESRFEVNAVFDIEQVITETNLKEMNESLRNEVGKYLDQMRECAFSLIKILKYSLNNNWIRGNMLLFISNRISIDDTNWYKIHTSSRLQFGPSTMLRELTHENSSIIQGYIDQEKEPFVALIHLHRAFKDETPRHMWIEATIAAELAIKEFLIRLKPDMEVMLLELPSPHLGTLYGKVLQHYAGEKYPKSNKLADGATIRNKLIHRPQEVDITFEKAVEYVQLVEDAIFFLLRKLYPDDSIINSGGIAQITVSSLKQ